MNGLFSLMKGCVDGRSVLENASANNVCDEYVLVLLGGDELTDFSSGGRSVSIEQWTGKSLGVVHALPT